MWEVTVAASAGRSARLPVDGLLLRRTQLAQDHVRQQHQQQQLQLQKRNGLRGQARAFLSSVRSENVRRRENEVWLMRSVISEGSMRQLSKFSRRSEVSGLAPLHRRLRSRPRLVEMAASTIHGAPLDGDFAESPLQVQGNEEEAPSSVTNDRSNTDAGAEQQPGEEEPLSLQLVPSSEATTTAESASSSSKVTSASLLTSALIGANTAGFWLQEKLDETLSQVARRGGLRVAVADSWQALQALPGDVRGRGGVRAVAQEWMKQVLEGSQGKLGVEGSSGALGAKEFLQVMSAAALERWQAAPSWLKWPVIAFSCFYAAVVVALGQAVARDLAPLWVLGPLATAYTIWQSQQVARALPTFSLKLQRVSQLALTSGSGFLKYAESGRLLADVAIAANARKEVLLARQAEVAALLSNRREAIVVYVGSGQLAKDSKEVAVEWARDQADAVKEWVLQRLEDVSDWLVIARRRTAKVLKKLF